MSTSTASKSAATPIQALNHLLEIVTAYCSTQAFVSACKVGIFEQLSSGPATAEDLAKRTNIHPVGCRRLLVALTKIGLIERDGDSFKNSEIGKYCSSKGPLDLSALMGFSDPFYQMFQFLPDALREYSPRWQQALGTSQQDVFGALYEDPVRLRQF